MNTAFEVAYRLAQLPAWIGWLLLILGAGVLVCLGAVWVAGRRRRKGRLR